MFGGKHIRKLNGKSLILRKISLFIAASLALSFPAWSKDSNDAVATAPFQPLPVQAFAVLPFVEKAKISPDGTQIAGLFSVRGEQRIAMMPILGDRKKAVIIPVPEQTEVSWIRWTGNDNIVVGLYALMPVYGDRWYVSRLIGVNRHSRKITRILWDAGGQNAADLLWVATDGSPDILVSAQESIYTDTPGFWPTVYRVDVTNGRKKKVETGRSNIFDWIADHDGEVRLGISYLEKTASSTLLYRPNPSSSLRTIDKVRLADEESLTIPFHFRPNSDRGFALKDMPNGRTTVVEMDIPSGDIIRTIYDQKDVSGVFLAANGAKLLGIFTRDQTNPLHWLDPIMAGHQETLNAASPLSSVRIESISDDQSKMLVRFSTADNPGLLYYFDAVTGDLLRFASINENIGGKRLSRAQMVRYKARDGLEIEAVLTMPRGAGDKNLPFIIMPHGGPWAHDDLTYHYWAQFLAERGYAVLQPNFRGSTGYGKAFEKAGQGQLGLAMQDDLTDAVRWAAAEGIADPNRVCIIGGSYGGYAAMWGIVKDPDLYRCAVSVNGVANLRREVNDFGTKLMGRLYRSQWQKMTPDFSAVSPINAVDRIKTPLLLIHGKRDVTVDHSQSVRMHSAMQKHGKISEFISVPLADHYFTREADRITLLSSIEKFLKTHNPPD